MTTMLPASVPATIRKNDDAIASALELSEQSDSSLAAALWDCQQNRYYKVFGFRSIGEYMRERWQDTEQREIAQLKSRSIQRLLREYKLALEIPAFRAAFDQMSRSNRRLICQVITADNAAEWILAAQTLTARDLEAKIKQLEADRPDQVDKPGRLFLSLYPGQREIWERTKQIARRSISDGESILTDAMILETCCQEFLSAYQNSENSESSRTGMLAPCPTCRRLVFLRRQVDDDLTQNGTTAQMYTCPLCQAPVVLAAPLAERTFG